MLKEKYSDTDFWGVSYSESMSISDSKSVSVSVSDSKSIPFRKFKSLRDGQELVIDLILKSNKKMIVVNAPTGTGKSLIGMMAGHYKNNNNRQDVVDTVGRQTLYVCSSKMLQDQLHRDFPEAHLHKGRVNYVCDLYPEYTADCCSEKCEEFVSGDISCSYEDSKTKALVSRCTILNTSYYLTETNNVGRFSKRHAVIVDEADVFEDSVVDFVSLEITNSAMNKYNLGMPDKVTKLDSWKLWSVNAVKQLVRYRDTYIKSCSGFTNDNRKEIININRLIYKIKLLVDNLDDNWLFEHKNKFSFRPLWLSRQLLDDYLYRHADQFVLMSATMMPSHIIQKLFCLQSSEIDYIEVDCPFPVENRTLEYRGIKRLKYGENEDVIYREIESIINEHKNERGIIHAVSYDRARRISSLSKRMITHNSYDKDMQLKKFYSTPNSIFVSPSSERGLDLKDELARFCIIPKVPYASLGDEMTKRRSYSGNFGNHWYKSMAAQTVIQMVGRGVRHSNDYCKSYILDSSFADIVDYTPQYFRDAVVCKL